MKKRPDGFVLFHEWRSAFEMLDAASVKELILALVDYSESGTEPRIAGDAKMAFALFSRAIDRGHASYEETCERNRRNAKTRWDSANDDATVSDCT